MLCGMNMVMGIGCVACISGDYSGREVECVGMFGVLVVL